MKNNNRIFVGDFETTVYKGQTFTEVWASASVELGTEDVQIFHSIDEQFEYFKSLNCNITVYYHNLKFDGSFWLDFLLKKAHYKQAITLKQDNLLEAYWYEDSELRAKEFKYSISDMGQWYSMTICTGRYKIKLLDSLKLLPFSVKVIGKAFNTKHKKLDMEYAGFRYAGCEITDEEKEYIANDVLVVKEALEIMYEQGHNKLTIGSCCLSEFKTLTSQSDKCYDYDELFPDLFEQELDVNKYDYLNVDAYIRRSYKGGWCYVVKGKENKLYGKGTTADVNSLYPSMMSSESGNRYPVGLPTFWKGNYIPKKAMAHDKYFFIRVRTRFYIKDSMLPFIQIKGSWLYKSNECLTTSDVYDEETGEYYKFLDNGGEVIDTRVTLTLTMTDYYLFREHYNVEDFEILDGCYFTSMVGIFDDYIEKYKKIKIESKGAMRTLAKLFLNNLYGKMASSTNSSFKVAYEDNEGDIRFHTIPAFDKKAGYIPIGSAITSYARNFTIRAAQKNYYGVDKRGFIYADTDSIHCDLEPEEIKGIEVHESNFCCWKLEAQWDKAIFARQKTYIEHVTHEDLEEIEQPYYNIKCAGMPKRCKDLLRDSIEGYDEERAEEYNEEELEFVKQKRELTDFKVGLKVPSKLMPKRISGGILLVETTYEMR